MKPVIVTGSKKEIVDTVSRMDGVVREAIVLVDETVAPDLNGHAPDNCAEIEPNTVRRGDVDDSRAFHQ